jgi:two-component system, OmpR family, response regulator
MPPLIDATTEPDQEIRPERHENRHASADTGNFSLDRIRNTARSIEDRVRRALTPPGSKVGTLRFLVVDDHPDAADALAAVLELLGCPVRTCYDGFSALRVAEQFDPQVCLLDLRMPGMDGLELGARLKNQLADKPLLLVATTALADEATRSRTSLSGFHAHLSKPVDVTTLVEELTRLWDRITEERSNRDLPG